MVEKRTAENPEPPRDMLKWIAETYQLNPASLAWMFQTRNATIRSWMAGGPISRKNLTKLRKSYYYLKGQTDPYAGKKFCAKCSLWKDPGDFPPGRATCIDCCGAKA